MYSHNIDEAPLELWVLLLIVVFAAGFPILVGLALTKVVSKIIKRKMPEYEGLISNNSFMVVLFSGWLVCAPLFYCMYIYIGSSVQ